MANIAPQSVPEAKAQLNEWFRSFQSAHLRLNGRLQFMKRELAINKYPEDSIRSSSTAIQTMIADLEAVNAKWQSNSPLAPHLHSLGEALYAIFSIVTSIEDNTPDLGIAIGMLSNAREEFQKSIASIEIIKKILASDGFMQSDDGLKNGEGRLADTIPHPTQEIALPMEPIGQNITSDNKTKKSGKRQAGVSDSEPVAKRLDPTEIEKLSDNLNTSTSPILAQKLVYGTGKSKDDGMEDKNVEAGNKSEIDQELGNEIPPVISPLPIHQVPVDPLLHPQESNSESHQSFRYHEMDNLEEGDYALAEVDGEEQGSKMNTKNTTGVVSTASHVSENQNQEPMEVEEDRDVETDGSPEEPMESVEEVPPAKVLQSPVVTPSSELQNNSEHPVFSTPGLHGPSSIPLNPNVVEEDEDEQHKSSNTAPGCSNQVVKTSDEAEDDGSVSVKAEKTKRDIIWDASVDKTIKSKFQTARGIYFHSRQFFAEAHLSSVLIRKGYATSRAEVRSYFESIEKRFKESNCFEIELPIGTELAGNKNYRGLKPIYVGHVLVDVSTVLPALPENYELYPPPLQFTGSVHMDAFNVTGGQIIEAAKQIYSDTPEERKTFLGSPSDLKVFPGGDINTVEEERKNFVAIGGQTKEECQKAEEAKFFPVVSYPGSIMHNPEELQKACETHHFFKVKNAWNELKLKTSLFEIETLAAKSPNSNVSVLRQIPQQIIFNIPFNQTKGFQDENQAKRWESRGLESLSVSFERFAEFFKTLNNWAEIAYEQLENGAETVDKVMDDLDEKLKNFSDSVEVKDKAHVHKIAVLLFFGSNIDLSEESFPEQSQEIQSKFPACWAPRSKDDLLKLAGDIPGMTHAQVYGKTPGSRTNAHQENNSVGSINVNKGPASCYWCVIPPEYNDKFQQLIIKKLGSRKNLCKTGYFPLLEDCIAEGIPVQMCEQKAGEGVYVGTATYHWVQCNGFATNISWNVCRPTSCQLAAAMIHHDHVMQNDGVSLVPLQDILCQLPNADIKMDTEMQQIVKISLMRLLIACTQELEFVTKKRPEWKIVRASTGGKILETCHICKNVLFNLVPKTKVGNETRAYCFKHLDNSRSKKSSLDREWTIHQRYDLTSIAEKFDMLKVDAPIF